MYASPRRLSRRDVWLGVRPSREVSSRRQRRHEQAERDQAKAFEQFIHSKKVGDVVTAMVTRRRSKDGEVMLECGLKARLDNCLDHETGQEVRWLPIPWKGQRIEVLVRSIHPVRCRVEVSLHTFTQDPRFNLFNAGYRSAFDGSQAGFALLPWEKPRLVREGRSR